MKKLFAWLLSLALVLGCLPLRAGAQELTEETIAETTAASETTVITEAPTETTVATETTAATEAIQAAEETEAVETVAETVPETTAATVPTETVSETVPAETVSETVPAETTVETVPAETEVAETIPVEAQNGDAATGTPDGTPPVLNNITLSVTTVAAPGTIEVTVDASDDVAGAKYGWVYFYCENTEKELSVHVERTYWDSTTHQEVPYADGKLHGTLEIDQYVETGIFSIRSISLRDYAENSIYYSIWHEDYPGAPSNEAAIPDSLKSITFSVVDVVTADSTPPVLNNITLSVTTVAAPGTIEVTVDASDDVSGANSGRVHFYCENTEKELSVYVERTYWDSTTHQEVPYADGKLHGTLEIDQYVETGTFSILSISLCDYAENPMYYYLDYEAWPGAPSNEAAIPTHSKNLNFSVTESSTPDREPPALNNIILSPSIVTAPGNIEVIVDASDDMSGPNYGWVYFYCENTEKQLSVHVERTYWDSTTHQEVPYADGKLHGTLEIDQYVETGIFSIWYISLCDYAENQMYYDLDYEAWPGAPSNQAAIPAHLKSLTLTVRNSDADITTSISKSDFVETVQNADDDAYIVADYSGEATLTEDTFEAIAGTDKTLDLVSEGITWRFEGSDIVNEVKPIDLHVDIQPVEETKTESGEEIQDNLQQNPGVVMKFAENGELPGKATIQVKVDYAMQQYLGSSQYLNVYYFNNETGKLELIAENLAVNGESYVEFPITHCSYYVLTGHVFAGFDNISMYRLYNPNSGEHFYTGSLVERNLLIAAGWQYEGVSWNAPIFSGDPVYRMFNPNNGDHHYTMSWDEVEMLKGHGWRYEGVAWNSASASQTPLYRLYNPNADCGSHHYTGSTVERDNLVNIGWKYEGIGWFGIA